MTYTRGETVQRSGDFLNRECKFNVIHDAEGEMTLKRDGINLNRFLDSLHMISYCLTKKNLKISIFKQRNLCTISITTRGSLAKKKDNVFA